MAYTWAEARVELGRLLSDDTDVTFPVELRLDGCNAALRAFAAHTALPSSAVLAGDGVTKAFSLPANLLAGSLLYLWDGAAFWQMENEVPLPADIGPVNDDKKWWIWPPDTINLNEKPSGDVDLYYYAHWPEVAGDADEITVPVWAREALLFYAAAYCLSKTATAAANIRQYNTKTDSGNPEHNPMSDRQKEFLKLYDQVIGRYSPQIQLPPFGVIG